MAEETGTFRKYIDWKPNAETLVVLDQANSILDENEKHGMIMTLRQLYYQMVIRNWLPNQQEQYNRLGRIISQGRMAGLVSWTAFEDRNRTLKGLRTHVSVGKMLRQAKAEYRIDAWATQDWRPEVWVEKAALEGVIAGICTQLRVDFFAQRGNNSQTATWEAAQRFAGYIRKGQQPIVFHFGDHDPSGVDITRDNADRLSLFTGTPVIVQRLALTPEQIRRLHLPPNPVKLTDSKAAKYVEEHGDGSWELDALPPEEIRALIRDNVMAVRDQAKWDEAMEEESTDIRRLEAMLQELGEEDDDASPGD